MSDKSSIPIKLSIKDKENLPNAIFFFRHINDLDFSLPLILFATNAKVIFYGKIKMDDRRVQLLVDENVQINVLNTRLINIFEQLSDYLTAILSKINFLRMSSFLKSKIDHIINGLLKTETNKLIQSSDILQYCSIFNFDHTSCLRSKTIIKALRKQFTQTKNINIISLPHGANIFKNRMWDYSNLDPTSNYENFNHFDYVVCNDQMHFDSMDGNKINLPSLRYTREWQQYLTNIFIKNSSEKSRNSKQIVLFLLSKIEGGVNLIEVQRAIKIIQKFKNIELQIKPHPRGLRELKKLNIFSSRVVLDDVLEHISFADCIVNIQSNALLDAYLLQKPVIFPKYMTSNDWNEDLKSHALVANTPDDFFQLIKTFSKKEILPTPKYEFIAWKDALSKWSNFFSSLD